MDPRDYEKEARQEGWRPEDEFSGASDKWVDAKTFVERGEKISGMLKKKLDSVERRLEQAESANREFGEYHRHQIEKERSTAIERINQLEGLLGEAINNGDGQAYTQINREINTLRDNTPAQGAPEDDMATYRRMSEDWLTGNPWYNTDQVLATYADGAADRLRQQGFRGQAYFDELTRDVQAAFPEKFENPNRQRNLSVGDGTEGDETPTGGATKKTFNSLPKDAKDACKMFENQGIMTRDEYLAQYDWDEEA